MTPKEYTEYLNKKIVALVAARAGTNTAWLYQIGRGHGSCSPKMAVALEEASKHYSKRAFDHMTAEEILNLDGLRELRAKAMEDQIQEEKAGQ